MTEEETQEIYDLAIYAFHKADSPKRSEAFKALLNFSTPYTHRQDGKLTSLVVDSHFDVNWQGQKVPMSGIGYVASYPEYRGNGAIRQIMTRLLKDEYDKGTALSYLAPFSYQFYGKFGYHYAFDQKIYHVPSTEFPAGAKTAGQMIRRSFEAALPDLRRLHEAAYNQGSLARSKEQWDYFFQHKADPYFAIYEDEEGMAQGYLIYEFSGNDFVIRELIAQNSSAKAAIYRFIASHSGAFDTISWTAPSHETLEFDLAEPARTQITLKPYMQARIVNLTRFLEVNGLPSFSAEVTDDLLPENNQVIGQLEQAEKMTIGQFSARVLRENQAILREYF